MTAVVAPKSWISHFDGHPKKITGKQQHQKLIFHSSFHVQRLLVVATKLEQVTIRVGNEQILVITCDLITSTVTQRATSCHHRLYMFLLHWIIHTSIHLSCPWFINGRPVFHGTILMITGALISRTVTQRSMICHHRWYLCLLHWIIQSLIHLRCPQFVNSHPDLHRTQPMSRKLLQYLVVLHLIRQITCHRCPTWMEVAIFMDAFLMCLSWHHHNYNSML